MTFRESRGLKRAIGVMVLGGVLLHGASAAAQDAQNVRIVRLGPVEVAPTLELRDIGVDTNVYNENSPEPTKDVTFAFVPIAVATVRSQRTIFTLRSATDYNFYARQESERSLNQDLVFTSRVNLARLSPYAQVGYTTTRQRISEEIDARARRSERRLGGGLDVLIGRKLTAQVAARVWRMSFDSDAFFDNNSLAEQLDRDSMTYSAGLRYAVTPLTSLVVTTEVANSEFDQAPERDSSATQTVVGADFNPGAILSGSVRLGFTSFNPESDQLPDFSGVIGNANVVYRLGPLTSLLGRYDRNVAYSYFADEPYYVRHTIGGGIQRQLTPVWDMQLSVDRTWHDYRRALSSPDDSEAGHEDKLIGASVFAGYALGPRTKISTGLSFFDRRSDIAYRSYRGWRVGTSLFYGF